MNRVFCGGLVASFLLAPSVQASTINATSATLAAAFASANTGDTIKLTGSFAATNLSNRTFSSLLTIDARAATFTGMLQFTNVGGIKVLGGTYGSSSSLLVSAVKVNKSDRVTFSKPVIAGNATTGHGIDFISSTHVTVDGGVFTKLRAGVTFSNVNGGIITRSTSLQAASDGFDIADSHQVKITHNSCSDTQMTPGAHPDCVQLWSIAGHPVQSEIEISDNYATGPTQGFSSFNPEAGGGYHIKILRNRVDTSWSEGIACYNCTWSQLEDNVVTTQPGALFQTRVHIVGGGHNLISGNTVGPYVRPVASLEAGLSASLDPAESFDDDTFASMFPDYDPSSAAAVPEPGLWGLLIAGFGMAGAALRRRRAFA